MRVFLDTVLSKLVSRKLLVFLTATGLSLWGSLDSNTWGLIAVTYIGAQGAVDIAKMWKHGA